MRTCRTPLTNLVECPTLRLDAEHYVRGHHHGQRNTTAIVNVEQVSLSDVPWFSTDLAPVLKDIEVLPIGQALKVTANNARSVLTLRNRIQNACNVRGLAIRTSGKGGEDVFYVWKGTTKRQKKVSVST
jgi:hypothetical protein